ncbi:MAG: hypothetical protein Q9168_000920 [Polycauliona sp. 1 TL-2023]
MTAPVYHVKREQANYLVQKNASKKMRVKKTTSSRPSVVAAISMTQDSVKLVKNNARSRVTEASRRHYKSNHQAAVLIPTTLNTFFFSVCFNSQAVHEKDNVEICTNELTGLEHTVEICPHETLDFARLQKIVNLPGFKDDYNNGINGLTLGCKEHYSATRVQDTYQCVIENADRHSLCHGRGKIRLYYAKVYNPSDYTGPHPGVLLESKWTIWLDTLAKEIKTTGGVVQFWAERPISLCPHKKLIDFVGPLRFLDAVQSCQKKMDPILQYELEHRMKGKEECSSCHTLFDWNLSGSELSSLVVSSVRLLGKADSPKDPIWLSQ